MKEKDADDEDKHLTFSHVHLKKKLSVLIKLRVVDQCLMLVTGSSWRKKLVM